MEIFEKGQDKIIWGDVSEALQIIPDASVQLIFADPPYNIGKNFNGRPDRWENEDEYLSWSYQWLELCLQKLSPNGSLYLMAATQYMPFFDIFIRKHLTILSRIVWYYDSSGVQAKKYFGSLYEPMLFCVKDRQNYVFNSDDILVEAKTGAKRKLIDYRKEVPTVYNSQKVPGNVWEFPRVRYRMPEYENHPSQKPVSLLERIILASSNEGDTILDPFAGTFTSSYVAQKLERKSIGIEIEEAYVKIGLRRLNIAKEFRGEELKAESRSYEKQDLTKQKRLL